MHAKSAARHFGGDAEQYYELENFIDSSKSGSVGDVRHRALLHHTEGIAVCIRVFGPTLTIERTHGVLQVPVRQIAERHILEDIGWIPSHKDWLGETPIKRWMSGSQRRELPLSHILAGEQAA
jgi:hypothetical protein